MDSIDALAEFFKKFPGIGPRQAKRFVYHILTRDPEYIRRFVDSIERSRRNFAVCEQCFRFYNRGAKKSQICEICSDPGRDASLLMIVSHDVDMEAVEKSGSFRGRYFIIGGLLPILEKKPEEKIRIRELLKSIDISRKSGLKEIILALDANPDGDNTAEFLSEQLSRFKDESGLKISTLGRGLSTGTELEYSDSETIKNALKNRF